MYIAGRSLTHSWRGARACLHFIHFSGLSRKMAEHHAERAWQGGRKEGDLYRRGGGWADAAVGCSDCIRHRCRRHCCRRRNVRVRELERVIIPRWRTGIMNARPPLIYDEVRPRGESIGVICLLSGEWGGHEVAMNACPEFVPFC